jgi:hypothetical protein
MKTPPIKAVKERFGDKAKLVSAVQALCTDELWLDQLNKEKGLGRVSNAKLLRLHATLSEVKSAFGSRAKLIDSLLGVMKRDKDAGFRTKLESYATPRLLDLQKSAARRSKPATAKPAKPAKAAAPVKKKTSRTKKAKAKAAAAPAAAAPSAKKTAKKK